MKYSILQCLLGRLNPLCSRCRTQNYSSMFQPSNTCRLKLVPRQAMLTYSIHYSYFISGPHATYLHLESIRSLNLAQLKSTADIYTPRQILFYFVSQALLRPYAERMPENLWTMMCCTPIFYAISQQCCPPALPNTTRASGCPRVSIFLALFAISSLASSKQPSAISYMDLGFCLDSQLITLDSLSNAQMVNLTSGWELRFFPKTLGKNETSSLFSSRLASVIASSSPMPQQTGPGSDPTLSGPTVSIPLEQPSLEPPPAAIVSISRCGVHISIPSAWNVYFRSICLFRTTDTSVDVPPMSSPTRFLACKPNSFHSQSLILEQPMSPPAGPDRRSSLALADYLRANPPSLFMIRTCTSGSSKL